MNDRLNNAKTLRRRHFLAGAAGTLLTPLAGAQTSGGARCESAPRKRSVRFIRAMRVERPAETDADLLRVEGDRVLTKGVPIYPDWASS